MQNSLDIFVTNSSTCVLCSVTKSNITLNTLIESFWISLNIYYAVGSNLSQEMKTPNGKQSAKGSTGVLVRYLGLTLITRWESTLYSRETEREREGEHGEGLRACACVGACRVWCTFEAVSSSNMS